VLERKCERLKKWLKEKVKGRTLLSQRRRFDGFLFQKSATLPSPEGPSWAFKWSTETLLQRLLKKGWMSSFWVTDSSINRTEN
jgi:hypothetical protein